MRYRVPIQSALEASRNNEYGRNLLFLFLFRFIENLPDGTSHSISLVAYLKKRWNKDLELVDHFERKIVV